MTMISQITQRFHKYISGNKKIKISDQHKDIIVNDSEQKLDVIYERKREKEQRVSYLFLKNSKRNNRC